MNLWIGDERSVSSIHKDHFENMYAVVSGQKTFTLLPPTDVAFLAPYSHEYETLRYAAVNRRNSCGSGGAEKGNIGGEWDGCIETMELELQTENCPSKSLEWLALDPDDPQVCEKYPLLAQTSPLRCTVRAGQVLYIPAMWYHRVSQNCLTVSVNYWYDQQFNFR